MPDTEAGKRLLDVLHSEGWQTQPDHESSPERAIDAIEAEAREQERSFYSPLVAEALALAGTISDKQPPSPRRTGRTPMPEPTEPTTRHGQYVLAISRLHVWGAFDATDITQIEAEAVNAALDALAAKVEGLEGWKAGTLPGIEDTVPRAAVLALIAEARR